MSKEFSVGDEVWVIDPHGFNIVCNGIVTSIKQFYEEEAGDLDYIIDNFYPAKQHRLFSSELEAVAKCLELLEERRKQLQNKHFKLRINEPTAFIDHEPY